MVEGFGLERFLVHDGIAQPSFRLIPLTIGFSLCGILLLFSGAGSAATPASSEQETCDQLELCFQTAAFPKERLGKVLTKEQVLTLKLERLQRLMERFPSTIWAKRAGLLSGVLLKERNPPAAIQFLRGAQRDFPVLDDYIRLWIGETQLNLGDAKEA